MIDWTQWIITAGTIGGTALALAAYIANRMDKSRLNNQIFVDSEITKVTSVLATKLDMIGQHLKVQDLVQDKTIGKLDDVNTRVARVEGRLGIGSSEGIRNSDGGDSWTPPRNERPIPRIKG